MCGVSLKDRKHSDELLSKMIFFLQSINKKFQPWYFSICLPLLIRLIIKFSCPGCALFMVSPILLSRLSSFYGLSNTALNLIASYLLDRTQSVSIQSHSTPPSNIFTGIPQGSVLGPLLFSLYTSPISQICFLFVLQFRSCTSYMVITIMFFSFLFLVSYSS